MNGYKNSVIYYISSLLSPLAGRVLNGVSISPKESISVNGNYLTTQYDFTLSAHEQDDFFPVEVKLPVDVMRMDNAQVDDRPVLIDHINISHKPGRNGEDCLRFDLVNDEGISAAWFIGAIRENHVNNLGLISPGLITKTFSVSAVLKPVETSTGAGSSEIDLRALAGTVQSVAESLVNPFTCDDIGSGFKGHTEACRRYSDYSYKASVRVLPSFGAVELVYQISAASAVHAGSINEDIANRVAHRVKNETGINLEIRNLGCSY
jgi:hypothetical protein